MQEVPAAVDGVLDAVLNEQGVDIVSDGDRDS